jgi:hypothetical protein
LPEAGVKSAAATVGVLLGLLVAAALVMLWAWREMGDVEISGHGLIALALGAVASLIVGAGLMALVFFSNRRGYDDDAHQAEPPTQGDPGET